MIAALTATALAAFLGFEPSLKPRWRAGDEFTVEIIRKREDSRRPASNGTSTTRVRAKVLETEPARSVVDWVPGPTSFSNAAVAQNPILLKSADALKDVHLELILDEDGNYSGLRNESEVSAKLENMLRIMLSEWGSEPQVQNSIRQVLNPQVLLGSVTREAQMYFSLGGVELKQGFSVEAPVQYPNPLGSGVLKAVMRVAVSSFEASEVRARISTRFDAEVLRDMTLKLLQQAGGNASAAEIAKLPSLQVTDETEGAADPRIGLATQLSVTRATTMGPQLNRLDEWRFRLVDRPVPRQ